MNTPLEPYLTEQDGGSEPASTLPHLREDDLAADPLLEAMLWLCRHHGVERTVASLLDGQRPEGHLTGAQAVAAMRRAGFSATLVKRPPGKILSLLMPVVLLLRNGDAVILTRRVGSRAKRAGGARYEVIMPGSGNELCTASEAELLPEYSGYAMLVALKPGAQHAHGGSSARRSRGRHDDDDDGVHWLWPLLKNYLPYYRGAMLAALLSNILMLVTGLFSAVVYDKVIPHKAMATLWTFGIATLIGIGFDFIARQLRSYLIDIAGKKADLAVGNVLFNQAVNIRLEHKPDSAGAFAHQLAQIEVVREFSTSASTAVLTDLPFVVLFVIMTYVIAGPLAIVLVVAVPAVLLTSFAMQKMLRRLMTANMSQHADLQGTLVSVVEGLEDVRAAGAQGYFSRRYEEANGAAAASSLRARTIAGVANNLAGIMQPLVTVVMLIWGVHLIHQGHMSSGALIGAVMFAGRAIAPDGRAHV